MFHTHSCVVCYVLHVLHMLYVLHAMYFTMPFRFIFYLCLPMDSVLCTTFMMSDIPDWLVVYTRAPAEHDHKLKVICLDLQDCRLLSAITVIV